MRFRGIQDFRVPGYKKFRGIKDINEECKGMNRKGERESILHFYSIFEYLTMTMATLL